VNHVSPVLQDYTIYKINTMSYRAGGQSGCTACEAGASIKPGAQAPGSKWWGIFRARETGDSARTSNTAARYRGLPCL